MSKLAHSNQTMMDEIELRQRLDDGSMSELDGIIEHVRNQTSNREYGCLSMRAERLLADSIESLTSRAITVWKDGTWKAWQPGDAYLAQNDPEWLLTITPEMLAE